MSQKWQKQPSGPSELTPYEGDIAELWESDMEYFAERYQISSSVAGKNIKRGFSRYLLPIWTPHGSVRGYVARLAWPDAPLSFLPLPSSKKALTYMHESGPVQSYYTPYNVSADWQKTIIVEDQLSAIKASVAGFNAWAMLGMPASDKLDSYNGADRIREIASLQPNEVIVALDADATDKAFWFARKWGLAFNKIRVAILARDIKDTPLADIPAALGVYS